MYIFCLFLVIFLTILSLLVNNMIVWWSIFILMTIIFTMLNKSSNSYFGLMCYFLVQEILSVFFVIFYDCPEVQFVIVLMKMGGAPLHFWVFSVTDAIFDYGLAWFLTAQKLPFMMIMFQLFWFEASLILICGLLGCYLQMLLLKSYKDLLIVSSTESVNWIMLGLFCSFFNVLYLFFYYFTLMFLMLPKFSKGHYAFINWEMVLVFFNIPFTAAFFVKVFSIMEYVKFDSVMLLLLLFTMFLGSLSFMFWLVNLSTKDSNIWMQTNNKYIFFTMLPLGIITMI